MPDDSEKEIEDTYVICQPWSVRIESGKTRPQVLSTRPREKQDQGHRFSRYGLADSVFSFYLQYCFESNFSVEFYNKLSLSVQTWSARDGKNTDSWSARD